MADKTGDVVVRRRRAALAGHEGDEAAARQGLADEAGDVRATALGALERMSRLEGSDVEAALTDPDPVVRRRAAEVSAPMPAPRVAELLGDADPLVVEAACFALGERAEGSVVPALAGVARDHRDPLCREAAVAALGAIGDREGLPAILAALDDKPAIRRRAVIALAPFDGPEVTAALARAAQDRDWQVRQAAEDLA
ncbi:MAG TPA: HEAT repeat domain-containing protein [Acidimicrobiales bacterium]|jgi:HEAT repeat protein|nr:HEAT repeat domain-containing protein [Acidimicrobiales bacterium]